MTETTVLICPRCQGAMRTYERSGVVIDQCTDCRGIFLDHGELGPLMDVETLATGGWRDEFRAVRTRIRVAESGWDRDQADHVPERQRGSRSGGVLDAFGGDRVARIVR